MCIFLLNTDESDKSGGGLPSSSQDVSTTQTMKQAFAVGYEVLRNRNFLAFVLTNFVSVCVRNCVCFVVWFFLRFELISGCANSTVENTALQKKAWFFRAVCGMNKIYRKIWWKVLCNNFDMLTCSYSRIKKLLISVDKWWCASCYGSCALEKWKHSCPRLLVEELWWRMLQNPQNANTRSRWWFPAL